MKTKSYEIDMCNGPLTGKLLKFAVPLMLSGILQLLFNAADIVVVGHFAGHQALAAVGSTGSLINLLVNVFIGLSIGTNVLVANYTGAHQEKAVSETVHTSILLSLLCGTFLIFFGIILAKPLLSLMGTPDDVISQATLYMQIYFVGMPATMLYNFGAAVLRATGDTQRPLYFLFAVGIINVILNLIFVICFHMGVAGAAIATNISQGVSAVLCLIYIYKNVPVLCPERTQWRLSASDTAYQMRMGIPMALQFSITASGAMVMQAAINLFGSVAVAAFTAASKVQNLVTQGMMSMGQTMASYGGQNYGKGDYHRLEKGVRSALLISVIYSLLAAAAVGLFLRPLLSLFFSGDIDMASLMPWAKTYIYMCAVFYIPLSTIFIFRNIMQGCGYSFLPMMGGVVELFARMITALIAMKLVSFPLACFCDPAAWVGAALFTGFSWLSVKKKLRASLLPEDTSSSSEAK